MTTELKAVMEGAAPGRSAADELCTACLTPAPAHDAVAWSPGPRRCPGLNLGTALIRRLLADVEGVQITGLARRLPDAGSGSGPGSGPTSSAGDQPSPRWVGVDLGYDNCLPTLRSAFREVDAVVHLAWGFQPSHDPTHLEELGVGGTRRVLEAAAREEVPHLVHMSSVGAYTA